MKNLFKQIPILNAYRNLDKSIPIILLIAILAGTLFASSYLALAMQSGMQRLSDRLGADIIVVPSDAEEKYEGALIAGEPSSFYMDQRVIELIEEHPQVQEVAPQLYLASLQAECCVFTTQLLAVDFEKDFSIQAWLPEKLNNKLEPGQVLGGKNILTQEGKTATFYDQDFEVVAKLDSTGTGMDNSIIMNFEDGRKLIEAAKKLGGVASETPGDSISAVMVDIAVNETAEIVKVLKDLNTELKAFNARAIRSNSLVNRTSKQIDSQFKVICWIVVAVWLLGLSVLLILFPILIKSRSKELAVYRILGAKKKQLNELILKEIFLLSGIGALIGTILSIIVMTQFRVSISNSMNLPFLAPTNGSNLLMASLILMLATLIGPIVALLPLARFNQQEIAVAAVEND